MGESRGERGNDDADGQGHPSRPDRQPVPCTPHRQQDRREEQQEPDAPRARRVVYFRDVHAHRGNDQAEGHEGECFHAIRHSGCHARDCDRGPRPSLHRIVSRR